MENHQNRQVMAMRWHPDRPHNRDKNSEATANFRTVKAAYASWRRSKFSMKISDKWEVSSRYTKPALWKIPRNGIIADLTITIGGVPVTKGCW